MEKTIANLKKLKSFHNGSYGADIDRAIKALELEPCEDCISRQEVIDRFKHWYSELLLTCKEETDFCDIVGELPSAQPKPKTGHWIVDEYGIKHCPFCNAINNTVYDSYCANCGSRNEVEE